MLRIIFVWSCIDVVRLILGIFVATLILGMFVLIAYPFDRKGRIGHYYARLWGKVALLANWVKVEIEGIEHLNGKGPYIFMSNHQGYYDVFALLGHLPYQFKWLVKKELFS